MSKSVDVSVIVPVYNVEKYIRVCLDTLVHQTLSNIEIIVVNDGTKDDSQKIIDEFSSLYPDKIIALKKENGGLSDARNYGLEHASGAYVGFVDSDDYTDIEMYQKLYEKAKQENADIVVCGYYGVQEQNGQFRHFQKGNLQEFDKSLQENPRLLYMNSTYAWNKLYRRELFIKTGIRYPKGCLYEDMAVTWTLFLHANKISKVDEPLYYYILKREGAITATYSSKTLQMFQSMELVNTYYKEQNAFNQYQNILCFLNLKHMLLRFQDFPGYHNLSLKKTMIKTGFQHMNRNFKNWKTNSIFFEDVYKNRKIKYMVPYKAFWYLFMFVPKSALTCMKTVKKTVSKLKRLVSKRSYITRYAYHAYCKKHPVIKGQVLIESFQGKTVSDSPFYIAQQLQKQVDKIYIATTEKNRQEHKQLLKEHGLETAILVPVYSKAYQMALATSEILVNNVTFPPYFIRRDEQVYLNTWHGTPWKTLGKKMKNGIQDMSNIQRNFLQSSMLLFPNVFTKQRMIEDYNLTNLFTGLSYTAEYPRNLVFHEHEKTIAIKKRYGSEKLEMIAYMPTWRGLTSTALEIAGYAEELKKILQVLDETLNDDQMLYVNLHSLVKDVIPIQGYQHICSFPEDVDNYEFLMGCDMLITDYSSVLFDFALTKRPVILFVYDAEEYARDRGMYFSVQDLPFVKAETLKQLQEYITKQKSVEISKAAWNAYADVFVSKAAFDPAVCLKKVPVDSITDYADNKNKERTVYFIPKIKRLQDIQYLKEAAEDHSAIAVLDRQDFTPLTQKLLYQEFHECLDYIVMDVRMQLSPKEELKRLLHRFPGMEAYRREFQRILPNIKVKECVDFKKSRYTFGMKKYIDSQNRR
ncbi:bifunctional glycosyltransferase family 2 protein/CDP-glycerol:glycerophosphate glycerophosphotransferase [[Clostridium] innocuum]|uniref:bifunctional glycosyltransferase/CDP-glycerol:glycerophosphate glycerophosphotransferase n=1 Tax=Clostridium innocuum TaxID=1522 RepID=UPI0021478305|nr:bifunctional glycosyltransferase family 2 protein/CDP-glycerol:glycerophosphate glycerophosphotransferase [[Clostridium] innocuum]MCR0270797.1 bifunctional glycosyltransferase family 2 protein/CDP-glycerol:glycerophosphate glycerophosphotransferase [[Clostridium] innocuum]